VGVLSAAFKQEKLDAAGYVALIESTTRLNAVGAELADLEGVHAMTDVTGFGLLGHALEIARGSRLAVQITARPPLLAGVEALAKAGLRTGASTRNWTSYGQAVRLPADLPEWRRDLLTDPQTSGGLLIAAAPETAPEVLARVRAGGFAQAAVVGTLRRGAPGIDVIGDLEA